MFMLLAGEKQLNNGQGKFLENAGIVNLFFSSVFFLIVIIRSY